MQTRLDDSGEELSVLERLLRDTRPEVHQRLAELLWSAPDAMAAEAMALELAAAMPPVAGDAAEIAVAHG